MMCRSPFMSKKSLCSPGHTCDALKDVSIPVFNTQRDWFVVVAPGPVRPAALATQLMLERSTVSRNLAIMQKNGWIAAVETSATGRAMSVAITEAGVAAFTRAGSAWRRAQADAVKMLGPDAAPTLNGWLGLDSGYEHKPK